MYSADTWRGRAHSALPYVSALFYVEIMLLVLFINFLYGRPAAVITGIILTVMLTVHVLMLFNDSGISRTIQLLLMDFHVAWAVTFIAGLLLSDIPVSGFDSLAMCFRGLAAVVELPVIILVTSKGGQEGS